MKKRELLTLDQIFSSKKVLSSKKLRNAEWSQNVAKIKDDFSKQVKLFWPAVCAVIIQQLMEVLKVDVAKTITDAWCRYREIMQYTDLKKYPPDKTYMVPLAEHTVNHIYTPSQEIFYNNQKVGELNFAIEVYITLTAILEIKAGKIMKFHTGTCQAGGKIKCEDLLIFDQKTIPFTLPGEITLGEGVPISNFQGK